MGTRGVSRRGWLLAGALLLMSATLGCGPTTDASQRGNSSARPAESPALCVYGAIPLDDATQQPPLGWKVVEAEWNGRHRFALAAEPIVSERDVVAVAAPGPPGVLLVRLGPEGTHRFSDYTETPEHYRNGRLAMGFGGRWVCFPSLQAPTRDGQFALVGLTADEVNLAKTTWPAP